MAQHAEPMDIDNSVCDFDNKENEFHHSNVLSKTPSTEKGYEELDISELNLKLRYSSSANSTMSKSYTANCVDNINQDEDNILDSENGNLTRSLHSGMIQSNSSFKKIQPLQTLSMDQSLEVNRNALRPLDGGSSPESSNIKITVSTTNEIDDNFSFPSSSSSLSHTPEAITPTKEIPKNDEGSPIIRGIKSVLNMFRPSQSPIPPAEGDNPDKPEVLSPPIVISPDNSEKLESRAQASLSSTPVGPAKTKDVLKRSSPNRGSMVFNDDLEKELEWKDETIFFNTEKIPIHKLFFLEKPLSKHEDNDVDLNILNETVEYMDISYNDSTDKKDTVTGIESNEAANPVYNPESDSEFLDCETTFTKNECLKEYISEEHTGLNDLLNKDTSAKLEEFLNAAQIMQENVTPVVEVFEADKQQNITDESIATTVEVESINIVDEPIDKIKKDLSVNDNSALETEKVEVKNINKVEENTAFKDCIRSHDQLKSNEDVILTDAAIDVSTLIKSNDVEIHNEVTDDVENKNHVTSTNKNVSLENLVVQSLSQIPLLADPRVLLFNVASPDNNNQIENIINTSPEDAPLPDDDEVEKSVNVLFVDNMSENSVTQEIPSDNFKTEILKSTYAFESCHKMDEAVCSKLDNIASLELSETAHKLLNDVEKKIQEIWPYGRNLTEDIKQDISTKVEHTTGPDSNNVEAKIYKTDAMDMSHNIISTEFQVLPDLVQAGDYSNNQTVAREKTMISEEMDMPLELEMEPEQYKTIGDVMSVIDHKATVDHKEIGDSLKITKDGPNFTENTEIVEYGDESHVSKNQEIHAAVCNSDIYISDLTVTKSDDIKPAILNMSEISNKNSENETSIEEPVDRTAVISTETMKLTTGDNIINSNDQKTFENNESIDKMLITEISVVPVVVESYTPVQSILQKHDAKENDTKQINEDMATYSVKDVSQINIISQEKIDIDSIFETNQDRDKPKIVQITSSDAKQVCAEEIPLPILSNKIQDTHSDNLKKLLFDKTTANEDSISEVTKENGKPNKVNEITNKSLLNASDTQSAGQVEDNVAIIDEEMVASANGSLFISVTAESELISENSEVLEKYVESETKITYSPPQSPIIVSKGYNINFDETENPFATKTKIRMSPPPGVFSNHSFEDTIDTKKEFTKTEFNKNKRTFQSRRKKVPTNKRMNSTYAGESNVKQQEILVEQTESIKTLPETERAAIGEPQIELSSPPVAPFNSDISIDHIENDIVKVKVNENESNVDVINALKPTIDHIRNDDLRVKVNEMELNVDINNTLKQSNSSDTFSIRNRTSVESVCLEPKNSSSSEQSTYYSVETNSSPGSAENRNVFNLPEIDDANFNPFITKLKIRQSPPLCLDIDNPCAIKTNIRATPEKTLNTEIAPINDATTDLGIKNDLSLQSYFEHPKQEDANSSKNVSDITSSSKATDDKDDTIREIHTEDEDTVEGPFLDVDDLNDDKATINHIDKLSDSEPDNEMIQLTDLPNENDENMAGELFIDAEAFDFLINQNKCSTVVDSGKESLFLKFDPLYAKRMSSSGVFAALGNNNKKQSTPKKTSVTKNKTFTASPVAGPSMLNTTEDPNLTEANNIEESVEDLNVTVTKPMMVVNPAVNAVTPRNKTVTTPRLNRRSLTFTSPAIAVIDRLLSMSSNNSLVGHDGSVTEASRETYDTDVSHLTQLRELLADKEINVYNLRSESKELKDRLSSLESQMRSLEATSENRLQKINELTEKLDEKTKMNRSMASVVEEYERTIASLIAETENDKKRHAEERMELMKERDEQSAHLASMEVSFNDLHSKYEKSKQIILGFKANEESYKKSIKEFDINFTKMQNNYELLKQHATAKLNHANDELQKINRTHEAEVLKLNAMIKRKELHIKSLEETLTQKTKANEELTAICDELINKVG